MTKLWTRRWEFPCIFCFRNSYFSLCSDNLLTFQQIKFASRSEKQRGQPLENSFTSMDVQMEAVILSTDCISRLHLFYQTSHCSCIHKISDCNCIHHTSDCIEFQSPLPYAFSLPSQITPVSLSLALGFKACDPKFQDHLCVGYVSLLDRFILCSPGWP